MSDSELNTSFFYNTDILSINLLTRSQRSQRLNYHILNNDNNKKTILENRIFKKPRLIPQSNFNNTISLDDSAS